MITMLLTELNNLANIRWIVILIGFLLTLFIVVNPDENYVMNISIWKSGSCRVSKIYMITLLSQTFIQIVWCLTMDLFIHPVSNIEINSNVGCICRYFAQFEGSCHHNLTPIEDLSKTRRHWVPVSCKLKSPNYVGIITIILRFSSFTNSLCPRCWLVILQTMNPYNSHDKKSRHQDWHKWRFIHPENTTTVLIENTLTYWLIHTIDCWLVKCHICKIIAKSHTAYRTEHTSRKFNTYWK